jgi:hypothetical protein
MNLSQSYRKWHLFIEVTKGEDEQFNMTQISWIIQVHK